MCLKRCLLKTPVNVGYFVPKPGFSVLVFSVLVFFSLANWVCTSARAFSDNAGVKAKACSNAATARLNPRYAGAKSGWHDSDSCSVASQRGRGNQQETTDGLAIMDDEKTWLCGGEATRACFGRWGSGVVWFSRWTFRSRGNQLIEN